MRRKVELRHSNFEESGLNNLNTSKSQNGRTEPGVWKGNRSLLACHTRCKCSMETTHNSVKVKVGIKGMNLVKCLMFEAHCWSRVGMPFIIRERKTSYCWIRSAFRPLNFLNDDFKRSKGYCLFAKLTGKSPGPQNKTFIRGASPDVLYKLRDKNAIGWRRWNITTQDRGICDVEIEITSCVVDRSVKLAMLRNRQ